MCGSNGPCTSSTSPLRDNMQNTSHKISHLSYFVKTDPKKAQRQCSTLHHRDKTVTKRSCYIHSHNPVLSNWHCVKMMLGWVGCPIWHMSVASISPASDLIPATPWHMSVWIQLQAEEVSVKRRRREEGLCLRRTGGRRREEEGGRKGSNVWNYNLVLPTHCFFLPGAQLSLLFVTLSLSVSLITGLLW